MTEAPVPEAPGVTGGRVTDLHALATALDRHLAAWRPGICSDTAFEASAWKLMEEAGELARAHARQRGTARRAGTATEMKAELEAETADMMLAAAVYAVQAGVSAQDLNSALDQDLILLGLTVDHADIALIKVGTSTGHLLAAHEKLPGSSGQMPAQVTRVIAATLIYAGHTGIDVHAAVAAKALVILGRQQAPGAAS